MPAQQAARQGVQSAVRGWEWVQVPVPEVVGLRRQSGPKAEGAESAGRFGRSALSGGEAPSALGAAPLSPAFLKHAEEQTVVGLTAVLRAAQNHAIPGPFTNWGVVGGSRYPGRAAMAQSLVRFAEEGAWGVSPHTIPHRSLHSLPGTISQALRLHGPNFGAGGGPGGEAEALLMGCALLHGMDLPGLWVVLSRVEPELPPEADGLPATSARVEALALALIPPSAGGLLLEVLPAPVTPPGPPGLDTALPFTLDIFLDLLSRSSASGGPSRGHPGMESLEVPLRGGMRLLIRSSPPHGPALPDLGLGRP